MQLLELQLQIVKVVVVYGSTAHVVRVFLEGDRAVVSSAGVPRGDKTTLLSARLVRGGALIMHMVDGKTPAANLP